MHYCEQCQRSFKTVQGLLGHQRMAHNSSGEPMQSVAVMRTMAGPVEERLDRIEGLLGKILTLVSVAVVREMSGSLEERVDKFERLWAKA